MSEFFVFYNSIWLMANALSTSVHAYFFVEISESEYFSAMSAARDNNFHILCDSRPVSFCPVRYFLILELSIKQN